MNNLLNNFFIYLGVRLRNENNLSDITWALMNTIPSFQDKFLEYCFERNICVMNQTIREDQSGDSRPDFYFEDIEGNKYLIEVKIYDKNMHFQQYINNPKYSLAEKSFIANYAHTEINGWKIKSWKGFIVFLKQKIDEFNLDEKEIINSYINYLKATINYTEPMTMNIDNISSLYDFYLTIADVISDINDIQINEYNNSKPCTPEKYGKYFYTTRPDQTNCYFWIGITITNPTIITFEFEYENHYWVPIFVKQQLINLDSGKFFNKPFIQNSKLYIPLKDECYSILRNDNADIEGQREILYNYIKEILLIISN